MLFTVDNCAMLSGIVPHHPPNMIKPGPCLRPVRTSFAGLSTTDIQFGSSAGVCANRTCVCDCDFQHRAHMFWTFPVLRSELRGVNRVAKLRRADAEAFMAHSQHSIQWTTGRLERQANTCQRPVVASKENAVVYVDSEIVLALRSVGVVLAPLRVKQVDRASPRSDRELHHRAWAEDSLYIQIVLRRAVRSHLFLIQKSFLRCSTKVICRVGLR